MSVNMTATQKPFAFWSGEQGSDEWLQLRRNRVTATDMATLFGISPFIKTLYDLWLSKKGGRKTFENDAMKRGSQLEGKGLNLLKRKTGIVFSPAVVVSRNHPIMASLDGFDFSEKYIAEIKTPAQGQNSDLWRMAQNGTVPEHYMLQMQTGLMITGAEKCYFTVYDGMFDCQIVEVEPQPDLYPEMIRRATDFYERFIQGDEIPDDKPAILELTDQELVNLARRYVELEEEKKRISEELSWLKNEFVAIVRNSEAKKAVVPDLLEVSKSPKSIRVDWKSILVDQVPGIDLEKIERQYKEKALAEMAENDEKDEDNYTYRVNVKRKNKKERK